MKAKEASDILFRAYGKLKFPDAELELDEEKFKSALILASNTLGALEQIRWERDIAIAQLQELGISFGQKIDGVYLSKEEYTELREYKAIYEGLW